MSDPRQATWVFYAFLSSTVHWELQWYLLHIHTCDHGSNFLIIKPGDKVPISNQYLNNIPWKLYNTIQLLHEWHRFLFADLKRYAQIKKKKNLRLYILKSGKNHQNFDYLTLRNWGERFSLFILYLFIPFEFPNHIKWYYWLSEQEIYWQWNYG